MIQDNKKTFEGIAKGMQKLASNPGVAAPLAVAAGGTAPAEKVSFMPDIEIEPDLKKEDLDKLKEALEEKIDKENIDLENKIDALKEELRPRIDKIRERIDELKAQFEEFGTKFEEAKASNTESFDSLAQQNKRTDKKIEDLVAVDQELRELIDDINDKLEEQIGGQVA